MYFALSRNPYNFQNIGKMNCHSKGKFWENTNVPKISLFYIFRMKQKSMQFRKHGKTEFS